MTPYFHLNPNASYDFMGLGGVMFRLSSEQMPLVAANSLQLFHGGAAYNFVYAMKRTFGFSTAFLSALPSDPPGEALYRRMLESGADLRWVKHLEPMRGGSRVGINWTDAGFGGRPPQSHPDRANEALGFLESGDFDLDEIFSRRGSRWFHSDGITPGFSEKSEELVHETMKAAKSNGVIVSYDLNYRHAVWGVRGGTEAAAKVNRKNLELADVLFAGVGNLVSASGVETGVSPDKLLSFDESAALLETIASAYPHLTIAVTWRNEICANRHELGALLWLQGTLHTLEPLEVEVLDRVGSGDAFDAGVAAALFRGDPPEQVLAQGRALSAHSLTTSGDLVRACERDLEPFLQGGRVRIER